MTVSGGETSLRAGLERWLTALGERNAVLVLLGVHALVWTLFCVVSHGSLHHDILESFAWGKEWRLGYPKHPPAYAWLAAAWFSVLPREDWAFYLLAELNSALGLLGAWALAGRLLHGATRTASLAMLALTPLYSLYALKYNANTALLALWPWTAYALVRSIETRTALWGAVFGLLAALAVLTKYYSALLLASCLGAALLHPGARAYFRSLAPHVAVVVGAVAVAPHVWWLISSGGQAVDYAMATTKHPTRDILLRGVSAVVQAALFLSVAGGLYAGSLSPADRRALPARFWAGLRRREDRWVTVLAFGPFVLTILALLVGHVRISAQFMIPIFFMVPAALLYLARETVDPARLHILARIAVAFPIVALLASPVVALATFKGGADTWKEPRRVLAREANRVWRETFGTRLDLVGGDDRYAQALTFYAPDAPSDFIAFDPVKAPWVTPERLAASGLLVACGKDDSACLERARPLTTGAGVMTREITHTPALFGLGGKPRTLVLVLVPPAGHRSVKELGAAESPQPAHGE